LQIAAMRMQTEANLASEFGSKLAAARSIPNAMIACQESATRRFEMMAEDRKHATDLPDVHRDGCPSSIEGLDAVISSR
jgi:hypothetical protein